MNRRQALSAVSALLGGSILGAEFFLSGCKPAGKEAAAGFTAEDVALMDEVGETIIPTTASSPGAKAAAIGAFMKSIVDDCYTVNQQKFFLEGVGKLKTACQEKYKKDFSALSASERTAFITALDTEAKEFVKTDEYKKKKEEFDKQQGEWVKTEEGQLHFSAPYLKEEYPPHYFTMIKQLTVWGYFTSEPGMTKALRYIESPGKFDGAYPYKKGDKAWALGGFFD